VLRPSKFAIPYSIATLLIFTSFGFLHGFYSYSRHLISPERWPFSAAFFGTTLMLLYGAIAIRLFAITVPLILLQAVVMLLYVISYLPGGASGVGMVGSYLAGTFRSSTGL